MPIMVPAWDIGVLSIKRSSQNQFNECRCPPLMMKSQTPPLTRASFIVVGQSSPLEDVSAILGRMHILRDKPSPDWEGRKAANRARYEALVASIEEMDRAARIRLLWTSAACFGLGLVAGLVISN